jgi:hypothetical protein
MWLRLLAPGAEARIDCKDNENNQRDYGLDEPEDPDDQIERSNTGKYCDKPSYEHDKLTHRFARLSLFDFHLTS